MQAVKILPKGQITIPMKIRKRLSIHEGDTLLIDMKEESIVLKRGKTLLDYTGSLPDLGVTIDALREKALAEAAKDRG
ncbi:MAG: AbrB/MazE/SpoVT family DNA-binding domain-containing protein [Deltaproteobacteria bacterium]|nr:AbrB/MazE/SpoVT family DNA-binding domain-containing protein [Deltaproteobacteria bacterium]